MKGMVYIHVPFCQSRCIYCDFYSTVCGSEVRKAYVSAACEELKQRSGELSGREVQSVYFGGGTPSLLQPEEIAAILQSVRANYALSPEAEITLEANPDDVNAAFVSRLTAIGINRMSLGVQSFNDDTLRFLRRRHNARQAVQAVETIVAGGIENVSIDLIYGLPGQTIDVWAQNLQTAFSLPVTHLSSYALSVESGTALARLMESQKVVPVDDDAFLAQYEMLMNECLKQGVRHYEISNFAKPGYESRHNSGYWSEKPYVGIGPGAHSFDGDHTRRMNVADLAAYVKSEGQPAHEDEHLTPKEQFNETVYTALRTAEGVNLLNLRQRFCAEWGERLFRTARQFVETGEMEYESSTNVLKFTRGGIFISDRIMSEFMLLEEDE